MSRLHQASSLCKSLARFKDQSLVVFVEDKSLSKCNKDLPALENIREIISFERNFNGQIYLIQDLDSSGHCTLRTIDLAKFHNVKFEKESPCEVPYIHVPCTMNYGSADGQTLVINSDEKAMPFQNRTQSDEPMKGPIETATEFVIKMFESNLAECFSFENKKRSTGKIKVKTSTTRRSQPRSKRRRKNGGRDQTKQHVVHSSFERTTQKEVLINANALPVVSLGWTTMDCNQYGNNACTMAGNIRPFLSDGNLPRKTRKILVDLIEFVLGFLPGEWSFNIKKCGSERVVELRTAMIAEFKEMMCGETELGNFRVEGITIVIPLSIGWHKDTLNCFIQGMTSVISINAKIPLNEKTIPSGPGSRLWIWLNKNGYSDFFPCSIILYSRKSVQSYCLKIAKTELFAERDLVRKCLKWAMLDRVKSVVDYRSRIWNNDAFPNLFRKYSKKKKGSRFNGLMWSSPAAYDKTVSITLFAIFQILQNPFLLISFYYSFGNSVITQSPFMS